MSKLLIRKHCPRWCFATTDPDTWVTHCPYCGRQLAEREPRTMELSGSSRPMPREVAHGTD